jgi:hypothetical protein
MSETLIVRLACGCEAEAKVKGSTEDEDESPHCQPHDERRVQGFVSRPPAPRFVAVDCDLQGPCVVRSN